MIRPTTLFAMAALATALTAEDFGPVVKAAGQLFQGKHHYGVVCDYSFSQKQVADLQRALPEGSTLTVIDVHNYRQMEPAATAVLRRGVQLLALLPDDPMVRDGSAYATTLVDRLNGGVPAFGTTAAALKNGCALVMGTATHGELLINPKLLDPLLEGTIGPVQITRLPILGH